MGERLMKYYQYVGDLQGADGRMKLAKLTQIPSITAAIKDDTAELISAFKKVIQQMTGKTAPEFRSAVVEPARSATSRPSSPGPSPGRPSPARGRPASRNSPSLPSRCPGSRPTWPTA
jgi:hypothetical protein